MSVVWRDAVREDLPQIEKLWDEQPERFADTGVKVDRPKLFHDEGDTEHTFYPYQLPIVRLRVAEVDGVITGFKYQEVVVETCIVTGNDEVMKSMGNELTTDAHWLKERGFRSGFGLVPKKFAVAMKRFLRRHPHIRVWTDLVPVGVDFTEIGD